MMAEGAGRVRIAERDAAYLARARWQTLAGQLRDAGDAAERAAGRIPQDAPALREAAVTLRNAATLADGLARP
jgi:hypothetical protein